MLRDSIASESVDLIYLDPPFNSNASYNVLFKGPSGNQSAAQIEAFDDTWHWTDAAETAFGEVLRSGNGAAAEMLRAMRSFLGENDMMAYLAMMAVRLIELHRVLKPTGSLYLHCDPTASHYLKILLDAVFGPRNFVAELVWKRTNARGTKGRWPWIHDVILQSAKSSSFEHNSQTVAAERAKLPHTLITGSDGKKYQTYELTGAGTRNGETGLPWRGFDPNGFGRHWGNLHSQLDELDKKGLIHWPAGGGFPRRRDEEPFDHDNRRVVVGDVWTDIDRINQAAQERLGYPTQKPVALLERIVAASSNPGDVVLDPFCGCGTTVHAAEKLGRSWIGIDVTHLAIGLIEKRLRDAFPAVQFVTHGVPQDLSGARDLARRGREDKNYYFEFEKWALSLIAAQPGNLGKKGADRGIDGNLYFGKTHRAIISVKAGDNVSVQMIRDLRGVIEREKAEIGVFLTLTPPTRPMVAEAAGAGQFEMDGFAPVPRLQIVTIEEALGLRDRAVKLPARRDDAFRKAAREEAPGRQGRLDL
ncbi:DNA methyltransferase [Amaricoccus sp.]|uniref:DNA methyltransferase n=1 Tax=Amaricoccus sp. TaxID=1872485 RepID=UPI002B8AD73E|nr:DNA methyltransferase [Amaricoccus sp.]HMQ95263.1 DNA methyltransferase [Amaricoccus sp.]